ncbi:elongation factor 1-delta-like isoform X2 [Panonychus citri]|uniref:elongation factor 1-delta-like isoform X2 n=1 Tax=Panonychus citri TaxID=50023 RepID=UPI002307BE32|nr:elongation factor 1-delta-like isoform X2 [Panonychus citri]
MVYVPERVWIDRGRYLEAESNFFSGQTYSTGDVKSNASQEALIQRIASLEVENQELKKTIDDIVKRVASLEVKCSTCTPPVTDKCSAAAKPTPKKAPAPADDDDDDLDLFGDDDAPKKPVVAPVKVEKKKKAEVIAKSSVVLEIKPWDDETNMQEMEKCVRSIEKDGLLWGSSKLVPVAYNVKKLQIVCVVEDDKVGIEELSEEIEAFEDYVQSVDVAAFNKI